MAATKVDDGTAVEHPPPATEEPKPVKEKKRKAPKKKKPKQPKTASHPPYFQMIKEGLLALEEKSGSSPYAIAKYMEEKHRAVLPANFKKILALQLKNSTAKGKLIKIKASYKLSESGKKGKETTTTTTTTTKTTPKAEEPATRKRTRSVSKLEAPKKMATGAGTKKKASAKKPRKSAPAKPKSIKSPSAKRAKKATAV